ncbi:unnamed protein product [Trichobilharzia regenti]|nr:unnamed protein product [Trichobilharzia regenti]
MNVVKWMKVMEKRHRLLAHNGLKYLLVKLHHFGRLQLIQRIC